MAQQQPRDPARTPGVQSGSDPNRAAFIAANCKAPAAAALPLPPGARPAARGSGRGAVTPFDEPKSYSVAAIPGIIAGGQRWRMLWTDSGNNADSPIGVEDGVYIAQNDKSQILKVGLNGVVTLIATETFTGGGLAMNSKGQLWSGQRALNKAVWQILPERKLGANTKDGQSLECFTRNHISDMNADSKGGVYFTMGGVHYLSPQGVVTGPHSSVPGNGVILSRDEKTLYVTGNLPSSPGNVGVVALDVQPDGSLRNERQFVVIPTTEGTGDGLAVDADGRLYVTTAVDGVYVVSPDGKILGNIPAPYGLISVAFGGPNKRTMFGVAINEVHVMAIDMLAQGFTGRPK